MDKRTDRQGENSIPPPSTTHLFVRGYKSCVCNGLFIEWQKKKEQDQNKLFVTECHWQVYPRREPGLSQKVYPKRFIPDGSHYGYACQRDAVSMPTDQHWNGNNGYDWTRQKYSEYIRVISWQIQPTNIKVGWTSIPMAESPIMLLVTVEIVVQISLFSTIQTWQWWQYIVKFYHRFYKWIWKLSSAYIWCNSGTICFMVKRSWLVLSWPYKSMYFAVFHARVCAHVNSELIKIPTRLTHGRLRFASDLRDGVAWCTLLSPPPAPWWCHEM